MFSFIPDVTDSHNMDKQVVATFILEKQTKINNNKNCINPKDPLCVKYICMHLLLMFHSLVACSAIVCFSRPTSTQAACHFSNVFTQNSDMQQTQADGCPHIHIRVV